MARNKYPQETVKLIIDQALNLFREKGYDSTSVQDIINRLGGLSKGAIYHHFKSKEEIFDAVCAKIASDNFDYYGKIRDDKTKNGFEKLKEMVKTAPANPSNHAVVAMIDGILKDPKFFSSQILNIYTLVAPNFVQPIIEQGMRDGSIKTEYPKELAEVIITLLNVWINPIIAKSNEKQMRRKIEFMSQLLKGIGVDLFDEETTKLYVEITKSYNK